MTALPSGEVGLLSKFSNTTTLTTIRAKTVSQIQTFDEETLPTDFARAADGLVFLTATTGGGSVRLRAGNGTLLGEYPLEGEGALSLLSLAPSGDQWLYARGGEVRLGGVSADRKALPTRRLETKLGLDISFFGAAWLSHHVGLWNSRDAEAPELHARSGEATVTVVQLEKRRERATLVRRGLGLADSFAAVTASGIEIFDTNGRSLGGADPFDSTCGRPTYFGPEVTVLDGETIGVGGLTRVSLFRPARP